MAAQSTFAVETRFQTVQMLTRECERRFNLCHLPGERVGNLCIVVG